MISTIELMEKKIPSIKKTDRKKGMTLVEVMAAMAILSILFMGISGMISRIIKSESKSNALLDTATISKSILSMFEVSGKEYINDEKFNDLLNNDKEFNFNTITSAEGQILGTKTSDGNKYKLELKVDKKEQSTNLYKVTVRVYDNKTKDSQEKYIYIYRKV